MGEVTAATAGGVAVMLQYKKNRKNNILGNSLPKTDHSSCTFDNICEETWVILLTFGLQVLSVCVCVYLYLRHDRLVTMVETFSSSTVSFSVVQLADKTG